MHFAEEYKKLNKQQKEAVDAIDGPVMVVAGPGTGKTQVLALRIANIIEKTGIQPNCILCLTFTNAGVHAMRERLLRLVGSRASEVYISTFHRFAIGLIEKHYNLLDFDAAPTLLGETEAVALIDEILEGSDWKHIRPRADSAKYFSELKSLMSVLKRENMSPDDFLAEVEKDIERIKNDPNNISSKGARKGELKREAEKEIESLMRTKEVVAFYEAYEEAKHERLLMDYDDVLAYAVQLAQESEDVRADVRENHLYVHVDEHQDSSGVQNAFLEAVWGDVPKPDIFVVGDDRQLIYGFGGASLEHFARFQDMFGKAKRITLVENYRSSQTILDAAESLLSSAMATDKLHAAGKHGAHKIEISECAYPRDEIIYAGIQIQELIQKGTAPKECAILVPKNYQVKSAIDTLRSLGIPVAHGGVASFFAVPETQTVRNILAVLADPYNAVALSQLMLDGVMEIPPLSAHAFFRQSKMREFSLETVIAYSRGVLPSDPIARLGMRLSDFLSASQAFGVQGLVQKIGEDLFFTDPDDHDVFARRVEVIRTFIHLASAFSEKHPHAGLVEFLAYLDRLQHYGHEVPLAVFTETHGVHVKTLHGSKGLEYENVWICHIDEASLMRGKRMGFALPEKVADAVHEKDELAARRELYVAITRAKERCHISSSQKTYSGGDLEQARILSDIPDVYVERKTAEETEDIILKKDPKLFVALPQKMPRARKEDLAQIVAEQYFERNVTVTLLNNFFTCPWTWYFRNMIQVPEAKTESLLLGTAVHAGIEYLLKYRDDIQDNMLAKVVQDAIQKEYVKDEKLSARVLREATTILKKYQKTYLPEVLEHIASERSVSYKDPKRAHLSLYGKIDLTEYEEDREVIVTDFKTGSVKSGRTIEKLDDEGRMSSLMRQLAMYSYLIENAERGTHVRASKLLFVEAKDDDEDAVYTKHIGEEEIDLLKKDIADYDELVRSGQWIMRECQAETYGKSTGCEYCALAEKLYE